MKPEVFTLLPDKRWDVLFSDTDHWRVGVYKPEFNSPDEIDVLEKHTCPELFVCMNGKMGILVQVNDKNEVISMDPGDAVMVSDYHNGFVIDKEGFFLVVERTSFETNYKDIKTGEIIKSVKV